MRRSQYSINRTLCGQWNWRLRAGHSGVPRSPGIGPWAASNRRGAALPDRLDRACLARRAARIVENMDNIHFFQRPMVARDVTDPAALDLNTVYAAVKGTTKHVGTSFTEAPFLTPIISMLHDIAGGEDK